MTKAIQVVGVASVTSKSGAMTETQEKLDLVVTEGPLAEISVEVGHTMNLGNYQSAKLSVTLKVPSNIDQASLDKSFLYARDWVDAKLSAMIVEAKTSLG